MSSAPAGNHHEGKGWVLPTALCTPRTLHNAQNTGHIIFSMAKDVALPLGTQPHPHGVISKVSFCLVISNNWTRESTVSNDIVSVSQLAVLATWVSWLCELSLSRNSCLLKMHILWLKKKKAWGRWRVKYSFSPLSFLMSCHSLSSILFLLFLFGCCHSTWPLFSLPSLSSHLTSTFLQPTFNGNLQGLPMGPDPL